MKKALLFLFKVSLCTVGYLYASSRITQAQVTSDGTVNTIVTPNGNVAEITGGETREGNLFHSFQDFSVGTGNEAFFNNANDISNIFSRVTGGNISNIDGLIRANGSASLFLINPAGILFGENARIDIVGSFFGSTADSIVFNDGEFSATDLDNPPVLTVNAPIGLNFRDNPGDITLRGDGNGARLIDSEVIDTQDALRVGSDDTIGIVGGNLIFEDATIKTAGGRIEIGSVSEGTVDLIAVDNGLTFDYSNIETFQDISLSGSSVIDASGVGGGNIQVAGKNISLTGVSAFENNTLGNEPGGNLNIFAQESLEISGVENELNFVSGISNRTFPNGTADSGDINIETSTLSIGDRALIFTTSLGQGNAGKIKINASESITLTSQGKNSAIASNVGADAVGNGGDIDLTTDSLSLSHGAFINANTSGQGNAGNININANETVSLDGQGTGLFTNFSTAETVGNGGNIEITTGALTVNNQGSLNASSSGQGNAGNVTINATENVSFANSSSIVVAGAEGGSIDLNAKNLSITSGSSFFAGIFTDSGSPEAQAGDINLNLEEDLVLDGLDSDDLTFVTNTNFGLGNPGDINVSARNITFLNGGNVSSLSVAEAEIVNIGNITLNATGDIIFDGINSFARSGIVNFLQENLSGSIGEINLTAQNLTITNGATIQSLVVGTADSGDINLDVANSIKIDGFGSGSTEQVFPSQISSNVAATGIGDAGSINIKTQNLDLSRNGSISVEIAGSGNGGNITIDAEQITIGEQGNSTSFPSFISADAFGSGNGGNITIDTGSLFISDGGTVEADIFGNGQGGSIKINASDTVSVDGTGLFNDNQRSSGISAGTAVLAGNFPSFEGSDTQPGTGEPGAIDIQANSINLSNEGRIVASTQSPLADANSKNINLQVAENITLQDNSLISAQAFNEGNGGNLSIDSSFITAFPSNGNGNDIIASAEQGQGGDITINSSLLGIEEGLAIDGNNSNDIDASSEFSLDGNVTITTPDTDLIQGTTELPANVIKAEQTTAQACQAIRSVFCS